MNLLDTILLVLGLACGLYLGYWVGQWSKTRRGRLGPVPSHTEYWIYLTDSTLPNRDAVMTRMVSQNPHRVAGKSPIGTQVGLLFSDIRLHVALVLRERNPAVFRPDATDSAEGATPEVLDGLARSVALVRVRYVSEEALTDNRHLTFMPHFAAAMAEIGRGTVVYDEGQRQLWTATDFAHQLDQDPAGTALETHVRWSWSEVDRTYTTFGLRKIGRPEWRTRPAPADLRTILGQVVEEALRTQWPNPTDANPVEADVYGDTYQLTLSASPDGYAEAEVYRKPLA